MCTGNIFAVLTGKPANWWSWRKLTRRLRKTYPPTPPDFDAQAEHDRIHTHEADLELDRLRALICVVFEDRHYNPDCGCSSCTKVRSYLSVRDIDFIDNAARCVRSSNWTFDP